MSDSTPWQKVAGALKLKGSGPVYAARCPAHGDKHESLSITQNSNGDVLVTCHAGCEAERIVASIGLEMKDLFWPKDPLVGLGNFGQELVYTYRDEMGVGLIDVVKWRDEFGVKKFRQQLHGQPGTRIGETRRVPYRLPELLRAKPSQDVFIVEGEKDVENAMNLGVVATCNIGGAGKNKWRAEWTPFFEQRPIVIIPDNDQVGKDHAAEIAAHLAPVAASLIVLELPGVPEKGDLSDWIAAGGTLEKLRQLVTAAREQRHPHVRFTEEFNDEMHRLHREGFVRGAKTGWHSLDPHFAPRLGEWTVITGNPGAGKSSFMDHLSVNLARHNGWKFGVFPAENLPIPRHLAALAERYTGKPFEKPTTSWGKPQMESRELEVALSFVEEHFTIIEPQDDGQSIDSILEAAKWLLDHRGMNALIIDPWNELDNSRPKSMTETEYIGEALMRLRRFARRHVVHAFVVAHPAKLTRGKDGKYPIPTLWDINGSAHWRNKADNGVVIYRNQDTDDGASEVHIQKIRFKECGRIGMVMMGYDKPSGCFYDLETEAEAARRTPEGETMFSMFDDND